ncbi:hypothetical protein PAXRUDRAFT_153649 [Paxillus rubicundulus Ve08.2h10]|uniref:Uncharacterized protein n=1 Tax=Paxillus rubicundulus Ve08.2h10 TaxID=930991 RepID=A0A0D0DRU9_9AGAM|nr:hypothetical protein PAXRUDRAFT_153649 [Paxillus rubicundulus Ve08.2h10]
MIGWAKSQTLQKQILSENQEDAVADAVSTYREEQQKPAEDRKSLQTVFERSREGGEAKMGMPV